MAFTRATIRNLAKESGVEIPKELEDALVTEHLNARNAYAEVTASFNGIYHSKRGNAPPLIWLTFPPSNLTFM